MHSRNLNPLTHPFQPHPENEAGVLVQASTSKLALSNVPPMSTQEEAFVLRLSILRDTNGRECSLERR